jgi:putative spermidine/putrescine transport system substrate-binding protein
MNDMNRIAGSFAKAFFLALGLCGATHVAAQKTIHVGGPGGSPQKLFQEKIIPAFKAKTGTDVVYIPGNSTDVLAKLNAQRGRQELNVAIIDDGPMYQAIQSGYCDALANAPVYSDIYETARFGGKAIGVGLIATGIAYNKATFDKNGWPAPTSWMDLTHTRLRQRFTTSSLTATYGVHTLVMFSRVSGGSEKNIGPGFDAIEMKLVPNVASFASSPARLAEMFKDREVDIAVWGSSRTYALKRTGFPVEFVYPKEGAVALVTAACPIVQNSSPEQSQAFIQHLLTPEVQQWLSTEGWGPTNRKTKLDGEVAATLPYGPNFINKLVKIDWNAVNLKRAEWVSRWNRTVER